MNKNEFKFLIVNTKELWEKGAVDTKEISITDKGVSLKDRHSYVFSEAFQTEAAVPSSFDLDQCGILYILDSTKEKILIFDKQGNNSYWINSISFTDPKSIAVTDLDIYVYHDAKLSCIARINHQLRWEREVADDIRIAHSKNDYIYVLFIENGKIFKTDRNWDISDNSKIILKDKNGAPYVFNNPVDIASDSADNIYILESSDTDKKVTKFNPKGEFIESVSVLYKENLVPYAVAADIKGRIFIGFKNEKDIVLFTKVLNYISNGIYTTKIFDSGIINCQWHKVVMDAEIPENTSVKLSYYASNEESLPPPSWSTSIYNPYDALLTDAKGKNIWFKIELFSDVTTQKSPLIKSLKVYFPRLSYLRYLPAVYKEDALSKDFLERFLSLFETCFGITEDEIENVPSLFDVKAAPGEFLSWLSVWLAKVRDENWEEFKWREFLSKAIQLYKKRGTRECLCEIIMIYTGEYPIIIEPVQLKCTDMNLQGDFQKLFGSDPYTFCVLLKPDQAETDAEKNTVKRIIDTEKPAHTYGGLQALQPWIILGAHTYLGINTMLSKPEFIAGKAVLPIDTLLDDIENAGQIERKSIIEKNTYIT